MNTWIREDGEGFMFNVKEEEEERAEWILWCLAAWMSSGTRLEGSLVVVMNE